MAVGGTSYISSGNQELYDHWSGNFLFFTWGFIRILKGGSPALFLLESSIKSIALYLSTSTLLVSVQKSLGNSSSQDCVFNSGYHITSLSHNSV